MPDALLQLQEDQLPAMFKSALIAKAYNQLTGAHISHFEIDQLSVFERDEIVLLINHADFI